MIASLYHSGSAVVVRGSASLPGSGEEASLGGVMRCKQEEIGDERGNQAIVEPWQFRVPPTMSAVRMRDPARRSARSLAEPRARAAFEAADRAIAQTAQPARPTPSRCLKTLSRMLSLPMIESGSMSISLGASHERSSKTAILEHLGRQHEAMVALLAELVNIDSGSYTSTGSIRSGIGCEPISMRAAFRANRFATRLMATAWRPGCPAPTGSTGRSY